MGRKKIYFEISTEMSVLKSSAKKVDWKNFFVCIHVDVVCGPIGSAKTDCTDFV